MLNLESTSDADLRDDPARDYERIARAIAFLRHAGRTRPPLAEVAAAVHLSEFHLQRIFTRWAGVSPKQFLQLLTLEHAKAALADDADLLTAAYDAGLSGPGRLHDLFVTLEAVTPAEFRRGGAGLLVEHGFADTPFGECLLAWTARGVCFLEYVDDAGREAKQARLAAAWPGAELRRDDRAAAARAAAAFGRASGGRVDVRVFVRGTEFQTRVWRALLAIPPGSVTSYAAIARAVGRPAATRAVGTAIGSNPVSWLIPCHRVLRSDGGLGGYAWGLDRKVATLAWERGRK